LTTLQELFLSGTQVTDVGLEHIKGLTTLGFVDLGKTRVTDAGLEHLKGLSGRPKTTSTFWLNPV